MEFTCCDKSFKNQRGLTIHQKSQACRLNQVEEIKVVEFGCQTDEIPNKIEQFELMEKLNCDCGNKYNISANIAGIKISKLQQKIISRERQFYLQTIQQIETIQELLNKQICDIDVQFGKQLIVYDEQYKPFDVSKLPLFTVYEDKQMNTLQRVFKSESPVEPLFKTSFLKYKFCNYNETPNIFQCSKQMSPLKVLLENNIKLVKPQKQQRLVLYDIETFKYSRSTFNDSSVPQYIDQNAHIAIVSLIEISRDMQVTQIQALVINDYKQDQQVVSKIFNDYSKQNLNVEIQLFDDELDLCQYFFKYINDENYITIATGFNASQNKTFQKAYDLPWLMSRANMYIQNNVQVSRVQGLATPKEECITRIRGLHNVLFVDFKWLVYNPVQSIIQGERRYLSDYGLNAILNFFNVPTKIEDSYVEMNNDLCQSGSEISKHIAYCVYDSYAMYLVIKQQKILDLFEMVNEFTETPFSMSYFNKQATLITWKLIRQYKQNGYNLAYSYYPNDEKSIGIKHGAHTSSCPIQFRYLCLNTISLDYASQYPNCIRQLNICHSTITDQSAPQTQSINLDFGFDQPEEVIYFDQSRRSLLSDIIDTWMVKKDDGKRLNNISQTKTAKLCLNTLYGALGQASGPCFDYRLSSSVTALGRKTLRMAIDICESLKFQVLSIDTDGFEIVSLDNQVSVDQLREAIFNGVTKEHEYMIMEISNAKPYMFPHSSKSYINKEQIKGTGSQAALTPILQKQNQEIFHSFIQELSDITSFEQIKTPQFIQIKKERLDRSVYLNNPSVKRANQIVNEIRNRINGFTTIKQFEDYTIMIKNKKQIDKRGNITTAGYLMKYYGNKDCWLVLPYNTDEPKKSHCWAPFKHCIDINRIDRQRLIEKITQTIVTFFKLASTNKQRNLHEEQQPKNVIYYKQQTTAGWSRQIKEIKTSQELQTLINDNQNKSFHESVIRDTHKMYFDIDSTQMVHDNQIISAIKELTNNRFDFAIAQAHKHKDNLRIKSSYHITVQVILTRNQNLIYAMKLQQILDKLRLFNIVDLSVYSKNHNIRIPNCIKINGKIPEHRRFDIIFGSFQDMLITNIFEHSYPDISEKIANMKQNHFTEYMHQSVSNTSCSKIVNYLEQKLNFKVKQHDKYPTRLVPLQKPYMCICCNQQHEKQDLYIASHKKIGCFARIQQKKYYIIPDTLNIAQEHPQQMIQIKPIISQTLTQNQPHVKYNPFAAKITFVISAMGTAKTKQLLEYTDDYDCVVALSFRQTFANEFASKFEIFNYQNSRDNNISLRKHNRVIISIDSLHRLIDFDNANTLFIVDEFESILDQTTSFSRKLNMERSYEIFKQLIHISKSVVVIDAYLQQASIDLVLQLYQGDNYQITQNIYQPKRDYKCEINRGHKKKLQKQYIESILDALSQDKRIHSHNTSFACGDALFKAASDRFPNKKIIFIHGQNDDHIEHNGQIILHKNYKEDLLSDVNSKLICDLFIHTSTLIAGVSIEKENYNQGIHYWSGNTINALAFVQGIGRVRNLYDKNIQIFVETSVNALAHAQNPADENLMEFQLYGYIRTFGDDINQLLRIYLKARLQNQATNNEFLMTQFISQEGYQIQVKSNTNDEDEISVDASKTIEDSSLILDVEITQDDVTKIQSLNDTQLHTIVGQQAREFKTKRLLVKFMEDFNISINKTNELRELIFYLHINKLIKKIKTHIRVEKILNDYKMIQDGKLDINIDTLRNQINKLFKNQEQTQAYTFKPNEDILQTLIIAAQLEKDLQETNLQDEKLVKEIFNKYGCKQGVQSANSIIKHLGLKLSVKRSNHKSIYELVQSGELDTIKQYIDLIYSRRDILDYKFLINNGK